MASADEIVETQKGTQKVINTFTQLVTVIMPSNI
jgi:hypothetical protein